jgi:hypothetical protein
VKLDVCLEIALQKYAPTTTEIPPPNVPVPKEEPTADAPKLEVGAVEDAAEQLANELFDTAKLLLLTVVSL